MKGGSPRPRRRLLAVLPWRFAMVPTVLLEGRMGQGDWVSKLAPATRLDSSLSDPGLQKERDSSTSESCVNE